MVGSIVSIVGVQYQNKNDVLISLCIYTLCCILVRETCPTSEYLNNFSVYWYVDYIFFFLQFIN